MFFYQLNHQHYNMITPDQFEEFLEAFDKNPFKVNENKTFRKQLIENIIKYADDHMSLITAAVLIKKNFTTEEIIQNYYANVNVFDCAHLYITGTHNGGTDIPKPPRVSSTRKYICPCCGMSVRATRTVRIACMDCVEQMIEV